MKILKPSVLQPLVVVGGLLGLCACATVPLPTAYNAAFAPRFSTEASPKTSTSKITFALIKANYQTGPTIHAYLSKAVSGGTSYWMGTEEHQTSKLFRDSLSKEVEALMIQKGFRLSGPFDSFNDMTFPQKKQADLTVRPVITLALGVPPLEPKTKSDLAGAFLGGSGNKIVYESEGSCEIRGRIDFEVLESLTGTKMWTKTVDITPSTEDCTAKSAEAYMVVYNNAVGKLLEKAYDTTVEKIDTYFNREEMEMVKQQSLDVRPNK